MLQGKHTEFTDLDQWIEDYKHYQRIIKIKTFAKFRMWKAFSVWRKNVRWRSVELFWACVLDLILPIFHNFFVFFYIHTGGVQNLPPDKAFTGTFKLHVNITVLHACYTQFTCA